VHVVLVQIGVRNHERVEVIDRDALLREEVAGDLIADGDAIVAGARRLILAYGRGVGPDQFGARCTFANRRQQIGKGLPVFVFGLFPAVHSDVEMHHVELAF